MAPNGHRIGVFAVADQPEPATDGQGTAQEAEKWSCADCADPRARYRALCRSLTADAAEAHSDEIDAMFPACEVCGLRPDQPERRSSLRVSTPETPEEAARWAAFVASVENDPYYRLED